MISILMVPGSPTSVVDSAIRVVTNSRYCHCAVLVRAGLSADVYEVTRAGMGAVALKDYQHAYEEWFIRKPYSPSDEAAAVEFIRSLLSMNIRYGYLEIVGMYLTLFLNRYVPVSRNVMNSKRKYICSELVGRVLRRLGSTVHKDPSLMTPQDVVLSGAIEPADGRGL